MIKLPEITTEMIKNYCGERMYGIGKEFGKKKPFFVCFKEWTMLKALCEGTESPSYAVRILLHEKGIANSSCTCYVNRSVPCKHIAALLIRWHQDQESIPERSVWVQGLHKLRKPHLVGLFEKFVDLYPDDESCKQWLVES